MKKILILLMAALLLTGCFGGKKNKPEKSKTEEIPVQEIEVKVEEKKMEEKKEEENKIDMEAVKSELESQISDIAEVTIDDNTLNLKPIGEAEKYLGDINKAARNPILRSAWSMVVDKLTTEAKSIKENHGTGITINVVNPNNGDVLLTVEDGEVTYDVIEELRK